MEILKLLAEHQMILDIFMSFWSGLIGLIATIILYRKKDDQYIFLLPCIVGTLCVFLSYFDVVKYMKL